MFRWKKSEPDATTETVLNENDIAKQKYSHFLHVLERELKNIYAYDAYIHKWPEERILYLQLLYLKGVKEILLRDLFYDHVVSQIDSGDTVHLPEIYPCTQIKNLDREETFMSLKGKCIIMTYRKAYSIANQIERVEAGEGLSGERCYLYKHLQIGTTGSGGNHRVIAMDMTGYEMDAPVTIIDDEPLLDVLCTDGAHWHTTDKAYMGDVYDYRVAIIFTITKAINKESIGEICVE